MIRNISIVLSVFLIVGCAHNQKQPMSASTLPLDYEYTQDFSSSANWNVNHDGVNLTWTGAAQHAANAGCDGHSAMRIVHVGADAVLCISIGDLPYTHGSIKLKYYHLQIDRDVPNSAGSKLLIRTSNEDDSSGTSTEGMYRMLADLSATTSPKPAPVCTDVQSNFTIHPGDRTIYIKLQRGGYPRALIVDELKIKLVATERIETKR